MTKKELLDKLKQFKSGTGITYKIMDKNIAKYMTDYSSDNLTVVFSFSKEE